MGNESGRAEAAPLLLKEDWLLEKAGELWSEGVGKENWAWVFLQEPRLVAFGVVTPGRVEWPPGARVDWDRVFDLRLFNDQGEWHYWRAGTNGGKARLRLRKGGDDLLEEGHFLWGTEVVPLAGRWLELRETRGAAIKLPLAGRVKGTVLPLRLSVCQMIDYDKDTGMAGIVDAFLVGLTDKAGNVLRPN